MPSVLITGCSSGGIGHALAICFQQHGLHVFATARSKAKMTGLENLPNVTLLTLDVTDSTSIQKAVKIVQKQTGGLLNYLVNNAGVFHIMPLLDTNIEQAKQLFDVNVWSSLAMIQAFSPLLIQAKGAVVNISSVGACVNIPWAGIYSASKAALTTIGEILRLELAPFGVNVISCMTGAVDTHLYDHVSAVSLPVNSLYQCFRQSIQNRAECKTKDELFLYWMSADDFAKRLVGDVLAGANGKTWRGATASWIYYASSYLYTGIMDKFLRSKSGLS